MNRSSRARSVLLRGFVLALAAGALLLAFRKADLHEIIATVRRARLSYLLLSGLVLSTSCCVRGYRWRVLLSAEKLLPVGIVFWANMVGYLGNFLLPARAGEVIRSTMLGRRTGISASYILATAVTERIMDVVVLMLMSLAAALVLPHPPGWLRPAATVAGIAAVAAMVILFVAAYSHSLFTRVLVRLPLPERIRARSVGMVEQFLLGARAIHHPVRASSFVGLAVVTWLLDASGSILAAKALSLALSLPQALVLLAALGLFTALPSTPGAVGLYQLAAVTVLVPFGYSRSSALAYILLGQACSYIVICLWGGIGLWVMGGATAPAAEQEVARVTEGQQ
jgi:hypothetical protein